METLLQYCNIALNFFLENRYMIYIVIFSIYLGFEVIAHVPSMLHTPLMSGSNALSGITMIGGIIVMGTAPSDNIPAMILGFVAVIFGTYNVVGGFVVTDRMVEMFKKKPDKKS